MVWFRGAVNAPMLRIGVEAAVLYGATFGMPPYGILLGSTLGAPFVPAGALLSAWARWLR